MAKLYFRYGAMNCGKTTAVVQVAFNYEERDMHVLLIKPKIDTKGGKSILTRMNHKRKVDILAKTNDNLLEIITKQKQADKLLSCILVDEAQFLTDKQVIELFYVAIELNIPVMCYGLRTDFQTKAFMPGVKRLMELAHSIEELKTICRCGKKAIFNGRKVNGKFTNQGSQVAIDGEADVTYESLCGKCYLKLVGHIPA